MTVAAKEVEKKESKLHEGVERTRAKRVYTPAVDIIEKNEDIFLIADMPGVDNESVGSVELGTDLRVHDLDQDLDVRGWIRRHETRVGSGAAKRHAVGGDDDATLADPVKKDVHPHLGSLRPGQSPFERSVVAAIDIDALRGPRRAS